MQVLPLFSMLVSLCTNGISFNKSSYLSIVWMVIKKELEPEDVKGHMR